MGIDSMKLDFPVIDVVPEMVELNVDVLGVQAHLWDFGDIKGTTVILEDTAMNGWLGGDHVKSLSLELLD